MLRTFFFMFFCYIAVVSFGQNSQKVVVGIAPLFFKQADVKDKYASMISGAITDQATQIKGMEFVSRSPGVLAEIAKEKNLNTSADFLNAEVLAEVGKRLGANYLLVGDISTVSIVKEAIGKDPIFGKTIWGKQANVVLNLQVINVSTGVVKYSKQISSNLIPAIPGQSDDKVVEKKVKNMGSQFNAFLQTWYNEQMNTASAKTN